MPKKITLVTISAFSIIFVGVLLRLWRLSELFHFTYDEEVFAFVGKRMFVNFHIPLIGGVTPMHVHVAPYFYWLSGIFLWISKLNPIGWGVAAAFISGVTILALFFITRKIFGNKIALIAIFLYAFSFWQNMFDRHYWGLVFDGVLSILTFYSLHQIISGKYKYLLLLSIVLAFGIHTDLSTLVLAVFAFFSFLIWKPKIPQKIALISLILFFVSFIPLFFFDVRHDFANSRGIFQYIEEVRSGGEGIVERSMLDVLTFVPSSLTRYLYISGKVDLAIQYSYCPVHVLSRTRSVSPWLISLVLLIIILAWFLKKKNLSEQLGISLIFLLFISVCAGVFVYGVVFNGDLFDHYLATLPPLFYILTGFVVSRIHKNLMWVAWIIGALFTFVNMNQALMTSHSFGLADKEKAVKWAIATTGSEAFSLDVLGSCFRYNGYRYLFYLYGKEPAKSYVDANFTHLYDQPPADVHPVKLIVITNPDSVESVEYYREYWAYREKLIARTQFGRIEVLLIDNSNLDFKGKF